MRRHFHPSTYPPTFQFFLLFSLDVSQITSLCFVNSRGGVGRRGGGTQRVGFSYGDDGDGDG